MGKQAKLMILMFVCSACDMTRVYYPLRVINAESEYVFIDVCTRDLANGSAKCNPLNVPNIDLYKNAKIYLYIIFTIGEIKAKKILSAFNINVSWL